VTSRHQAREAALQILYFWQVSGAGAGEAVGTYFAEHLPDASDEVRAFARELVVGTVGEVADLDRLIAAHAQNWRIERLAVIDRQILRLGAWELRHHHSETPAAIVMNEALELARTFSGDEAVPFVNGVLDSIRKDLERERPGP
jgi:N utilization substance protein B